MSTHAHRRPGLSPGTLIVDPNATATTVRVLRYSADTLSESEIHKVSEIPPIEPGTTLWIEVVGLKNLDLLRDLGERFDLHPLVVEDVVNVNQRPKAESYGVSEHFIVARMPIVDPRRSRWTTEQVSLVVKSGLVVLFQEKPSPAFDSIKERLREGRVRLRSSGVDYLTYAILDSIVDAFYPVLLDLSTELEATEDQLLDDADNTELKTLHNIRRNLIRLRRAALPLREALGSLLRDPEVDGFFRPETLVFLRDAHDHATRTLEQIDNDRELAASLADLYLSMVSNRTNDVMKVLTMIATVFIPLSFLVGLYGMNFDTNRAGNMPELDLPYAYPLLLALMVSIGIGFVVFFKRKGWL
ncbi:MAG: magnesium/cobalt transporter CorA [Thermoanaerobaculia bacterium]|nr:magnesium/cobalt transporter CorA [Thermoanaerobaculia bacterium]